jgi:hypothetical protein
VPCCARFYHQVFGLNILFVGGRAMKYSEKIEQIEKHLSEFGIELWELRGCHFVDIHDAATALQAATQEQPCSIKYFIATLEVAIPITPDK